ncbi:MAG: GntR family transcriptional regulator [Lachnospiraceae bacterium]|nr:GntR family transcriptional regulator [Lachnospiraceae bacterium]MBO7531759.1 GntR family transcriptional regulator [Lachnospiraceae bacterium]MBP5472467.1 GntR family transcriptional regulator [Lachnospiraceae bacterium]MBP5702107.1 GntR family transcriptional regulator [Lachnospiraceae bacterium]MBP5762831.1 GntR family transcriptional regulator [Lachnospiraceae bacterium]
MIISQSSKDPIYQQIADSFRADILEGRLKGGEYLPSIRGLAKELRISVITTMKAYEQLEEEGLITAVQGKGYIINEQNTDMLKEQHMRKVEDALMQAIASAKIAGLSDKELTETLKILLSIREN